MKKKYFEDILLLPLDKISNLIPNSLEITITVKNMCKEVSPTGREWAATEGSPLAYAMGLVAQAGAVGYATGHYSGSTTATLLATLGSIIIPPLVKNYRKRRDQEFPDLPFPFYKRPF
jgi:hypothetical protein